MTNCSVTFEYLRDLRENPLDPEWIELLAKFGTGLSSKASYLLYLRNRNEKMPYHYLASKEGDPVGMVIFDLVDWGLSFKIGGKVVFRIPLTRLVCTNTNAHIRDFPYFREIPYYQICSNHDVDVITINGFPVEYLNNKRRMQIEKDSIVYFPMTPYDRLRIRINSNFDSYISKFSSKTRSTLRNKIRKLDRTCKSDMNLKVYRSPHSTDEFLQNSLKVSRKTYQHKLYGVGLSRSPDFVDQVRFLAQQGFLLGFILYDGDRAVSFLFGTCIDEEFQFINTGYDPSYRNYSVGLLTFFLAIEWMCGSELVRIIDLGTGASELKRRFSNDSYSCVDLYVFRKSVKNLLIVLGHYIFNLIVESALLGLERVGLKQRLRSWWEMR